MEQMLCVRYLANEEKWSAKWYSKTECECACGISTYSLFIVSEKTPIVADHELFLLLRTLRLLPQLLLCSFSLPVFFFFFSRASSLHHYNIFTRPLLSCTQDVLPAFSPIFFFFFFFLFPTSVITSLFSAQVDVPASTAPSPSLFCAFDGHTHRSSSSRFSQARAWTVRGQLLV